MKVAESIRITTLFLALQIFLPQDIHAAPPPVQKFDFKASESKILPGNSGEKQKAFNCSGVIQKDDRIGSVAVVALFSQNACYTDGNYNNREYPMEWGIVTSKDGATKFPAVRVFPPKKRAVHFLASTHVLYYESGEDQDVFGFEGGLLTKVTSTIAATDGFRKADSLVVSFLDQPRVYVFVPKRMEYSPYHKNSKDSESGRIFEDGNYSVDKYRFSVSGKIFDTVRDFNFGPESGQAIYGQNRTFFLNATKKGFNVVWQDRANDQVYLSQFDPTLKNSQQKKLTSLPKYMLAAATSDEKGNSYYILIEKDSGASPPRTRRAAAFKTSGDGKNLKKVTLDTSANGLNITSFGDNFICSMAYSNGKVGTIISRQMHRAGDGGYHQGAIAVVFDAENLKLLNNTGQTSGHSFGNAMAVDSDGKFLAIDLGDNYPRGVTLHRFDEKGRAGRLLYSVKTAHASSPRGTYPVYKEISGGGKTFYKWSNDNHTYSEIGGVEEAADRILIFFAGEPDSEGKSLNNSRIGANLNDARNLGMVIVKKDFTQGDAILSQGVNETGGFYTFLGTYSPQENKGIHWLTRYENKALHNVSRVKTASVGTDRIFILHEIWAANSYSSTQLTLLQASTGQVIKSVNIGPTLQLGWHDDLIVRDGVVYTATGNATDGKIEIVAISVK